MILIGELPDLEDTASGKDLIRIGLDRAILRFLTARFKTIPAAIQEKVAKLTPNQADRLIEFLAQCQTLEEVDQWLVSELGVR